MIDFLAYKQKNLNFRWVTDDWLFVTIIWQFCVNFKKSANSKQTNQLTQTRTVKKVELTVRFPKLFGKGKSRKPMETLAMRSSFTLCWEPSCNTNWDQSGKNQLGSSSVTDAAALKTSGARERTQAPLHSSRSLWQQNLK